MTKNLRAAALSLAAVLSASAAFAQSAVEPKGAPLCTPDAHTLCLNAGRFSVTADFQQSASGPSVQATAVTLTDATGYFWFFDSANIELIVKVLNGCPVNNHYWAFEAGLTNVGVVVTVKDLLAGQQFVFDNPIGTPFPPIQNTTAFATCP